MGNKRMRHLNELRARALAGDNIAAKALENELRVPHHLRRSEGRLAAIHRRLETKFKDGLAITAKTLQGRRTRDAVTISPDYGMDRLQMLKDRRERRATA